MSNRTSDPPLDEIQWRSPPIAQEMQGIHTNSVLHYFARSPFFDPTSNNAVLVSQFQHNPRMVYIVATREVMEARLKTMSGLEFVVAQEPAEMDPGTGTGVWVIRKQTRRKRQGQEDEVMVHATYFVVGDNIYMAPTVGDVLGNRMLSIFSSLNTFFNKAAALPSFSPALGRQYEIPTSKPRLRANDIPSQMSKENTPMPDAPGVKKGPAITGNITYQSTRLLDDSFRLSLQYGDEYMDENPITGEPGAFHFSSTGRVSKDRLTVQPATKPAIMPGRSPAPPTPEVRTSDISPVRKDSKSTKSPKTPGMPKPKRRKSKALSGGVTPS